jgi:hypothetical protein
LNAFDMAREGLQAALGSAVSEADAHDHEILRENIRVRTNGDFANVNFTVNKLRAPDMVEGLFMVTFAVAEPPVDDDPEGGDESAKPGDQQKPSRIDVLEREIQYTNALPHYRKRHPRSGHDLRQH